MPQHHCLSRATGPSPPAPHFLTSGAGDTQQTSRLQSLGPAPFSTPPMPKKKLHFAQSPQSETQRKNAAALGHSPGPSPSWEHTLVSQQSWQPPTAPSTNVETATGRDTATSAAPTVAYLPRPHQPTQFTPGGTLCSRATYMQRQPQSHKDRWSNQS